MNSKIHHPFRTNEGLLRVALFVAAVCFLVVLASNLLQLDLLRRMEAGEQFLDSDYEANDSRQQVVAVVQLVVVLTTGVIFLMWFYKAYRNLKYLGVRGLEYSPGWAVGGFFVPFLNFFRPFQVMRELWNASGREWSPPTQSLLVAQPASRQKTPKLIQLWWGLFLVSSFIGQIGLRLGMRANPTLSGLQWSTWLDVASCLVDIPGVLLTAALAKKIGERQAALWNSRELEIPSAPPADQDQTMVARELL